MQTNNLVFKDFKKKKRNKKIQKQLKEILNSKDQVIKSLSKQYNYSFKKKSIKKFKKFKEIRIFGMGGSALGSKAIYDFLRNKIKKNFYFISNLNKRNVFPKKNI